MYAPFTGLVPEGGRNQGTGTEGTRERGNEEIHLVRFGLLPSRVKVAPGHPGWWLIACSLVPCFPLYSSRRLALAWPTARAPRVKTSPVLQARPKKAQRS